MAQPAQPNGLSSLSTSRDAAIPPAPGSWYRGFHRFCNWVYFHRITLIHPEPLPESGPVLYLGLHRNGAVDGFIYNCTVPQATFMISTQLRKNLLGRLFFSGIEVVRSKDEGDRETNAQALQTCLQLLRAGGRLFVFPEGTSSLGPRHLPFKSGATQILLAYLAGGGPIRVVPLGIHYEWAWGFQSNVEIVAGPAISLELPSNLSPRGRLKEMKPRLQAALEGVGVNVESEPYQETIQCLAQLAIAGTRRSYFRALKALEHAIPENILQDWQALERELAPRRLWRYQGAPLFPNGPTWKSALALLTVAPGVIAGAAANAGPLWAAYWAGKKFPDDRNVISLWRILVGIPLLMIWFLLVAGLTVWLGKPWWLGAYCLVTLLGLRTYANAKKLTVAVANGLRHPDLKPSVLALQRTLRAELADENHACAPPGRCDAS